MGAFPKALRTTLISSFLLGVLIASIGCKNDKKVGLPDLINSWPEALHLSLFRESARARHIPARRVAINMVAHESYALFPGQEIEDIVPGKEGVLAFEVGCIINPATSENARPGLRLQVRITGNGTVVSEELISVEVGAWKSVRMELGDRAGNRAGEGTRTPLSVQFKILPEVDSNSPGKEIAVAIGAPRIAHARPGRPNLIMINIDTLRPDHLGAYGYGRKTSPNLDALARESAVFEQCHAQASWTPPSVASLFTSLYPPQHGSLGKDRIVLGEQNLTLAEILADQGYATAAFSSSPFIHPDFGFGQGFMTFGFDPTENAGALNASVFDWLGKRPEEPFFLYVMYFDPHYTYNPPAPYNEMFKTGPGEKALWDPSRVVKLKSLFELDASVGRDTFQFLESRYDAEVAYTDFEFGRLMSTLHKSGLLDSSVLIVTSDHGEEFLEHAGFGHGNSLYQEILRVLLMIREPGPSRPGSRIKQTIRQVDVMPTALELLDIPLPRPVEGKSLIGLLRDPNPGPDRTAFASCNHLFHEGETMRSLRKDDLKLILFENPDRALLYDLSTDREEFHNLARERPELLHKMTEELIEFERNMLPGPAGSTRTTSPERTKNILKSLGYVGP